MKHPARLKSKVSRIILNQSGRWPWSCHKNGVWGGACCITPVCDRVLDSRPRGRELLKGRKESNQTKKLTQSDRGHGAAIKMRFGVGHVVSLLFVIECLTQDQGAASSSLTSITALWSLSKTHLS